MYRAETNKTAAPATEDAVTPSEDTAAPTVDTAQSVLDHEFRYFAQMKVAADKGLEALSQGDEETVRQVLMVLRASADYLTYRVAFQGAQILPEPELPTDPATLSRVALVRERLTDALSVMKKDDPMTFGSAGDNLSLMIWTIDRNLAFVQSNTEPPPEA